MTNEELTKLEELAKEAYPGPYKAEYFVDGFWGMPITLPYIVAACNAVPKMIDEIRSLRQKLDMANEALTFSQSYWMQAIDQRDTLQGHLNFVNKINSSMERELLGVKRVVELAYENRLAIPGMLQAINNYEDALKPG